MAEVAETAGRLANKARELEAASVEAINAQERAARLEELEERVALIRHREQARRIHATRVAERVQLQMMSSQHLPG